MMARIGTISALVCSLILASGSQTAEPMPLTLQDETTLKAAGIAVDAASLLRFFRDRTVNAETRQRLTDMIRRLGDESFQKREQATRDVIAAGRPAIPYLRQALQTSDLEVVRRAERCLQAIDP